MIETALWFFFETKLGKLTAGALLVAGLFIAWLIPHDVKVAAKAEQTVVERAEDFGTKANAKNEKVRRDAAKPGAAERMRAKACRDCKQ